MTPEEQQALVQFFGTVHAQAKQTDRMIVGNSQFVKPVSPAIQHQLEEALRKPIQHNIQQHQTIPQPFVEQPLAIQTQPEVTTHYSSPASNIEVLSNNETVEVLKEINLNLGRIANILEKKYGTPKKIKLSKPD